MAVKLAYKGRSWGTVQLVIAPAEGIAGQEIDRVPARPLDPVQLDGPDRIACVSVRDQIAQKLHARTEIYIGGRENDRFRDLIDVQLLRDLLDDNEMPAVREARTEIFALRAKHAWQPSVTVWPSCFAAMAREIDFHHDGVDVAADDLRLLISEIDRAG